MTTAGPPDPGWYTDPLGSVGSRWWDGAAWAGPVSLPQPPGRRLPGWAKTCFAVGIGLAVTNLALISLMLFIVVFFVGGDRTVSRTGDLWVCAAVGLAVASVAAAARGANRVRLGALIAAIAVIAGSWTWYSVIMPGRPKPTLAELKRSPAAQLIYPGAVVAAEFTGGRDSFWQDDLPNPAVFSRAEATNDTWPQVLAWFNQRLTADGWTRDDAAAVSGNVGISLVGAWTRGNEKFTLSVYSGTGRDALYKQTPELRGRAIALDTSLS
jgi:Protein of unknown function (DUF2510)